MSGTSIVCHALLRTLVWALLVTASALPSPGRQMVRMRLQDPPPEEQADPGQVPTLPDTIVRGRAAPFPATPLPPDIVVAPTRGETPAAEVGTAVTVITGEELRRYGRTSVAEALRPVVGLDVVRQGPPGGLTSVFLRGGNSQHTKVLLDGIPVNDPSNATRGFDFSSLSVDNIERIEILRGPQSVLYGSDAIGGTINIITRRGEGPLTLRAQAGGGSLGTGETALHASAGNACWYYSVSGSYFDTAGVSSASRRRGNTERDGFNLGTVGGRMGWTPSDLFQVDYVFRWSDAQTEIDDFDFVTGLPIDNLARHNLARQFYQRAQISSSQLDGIVQHVVGFNLTDYRRRDTDSGPFVPERFLGQTREVTYQGAVRLTETNRFTVGTSYLHEEASSSFVSQVAQYATGVFVQDEFRLGRRWFGTAGARWDDYSSAGPASTYRITNLIRVDETGTDFHGTIGTGFRAPALAENLFQFGNPNLRPERSKGWDVGARQWITPFLQVDATYFRNDFRDLIVFDFNTFQLDNVGRARASGVELTALWELTDSTSVSGGYTHTTTRDLATGAPLLRRPAHTAYAGLARTCADGRATVRADLLYIGPRLDTRSTILHEYYLVNLSGEYELFTGCTGYARVENILDEDYEEVRGFGAPGIQGHAGLRWQH